MDSNESSRSVPLADGLPTLGIGTWQNEEPEQCAESVRTALEAGYRHVDTAQIYGNESAVGEGIARSSVDRADVFIATKVWKSELARDDVIASTEASLERLGVDSLDLLYVHWPVHAYDPTETLPAFAELRDRGSIDRIGVSNFEPDHLERAREVIDDPIFANQVEMHPLLQQRELREYAADSDVELVAYSPLARGRIFEVETVSEIAAKHGVSEAQVSLAWLREKSVTAVPKATSREHVLDNWASLDLELDEGDVRAIDDLDRTSREIDPGWGPDAWT